VRSLGIVMLTPLLDQDLGFPEGIKGLPIEQLVAEPGIDALDVPVLSG
jgi:hypothetical protein